MPTQLTEDVPDGDDVIAQLLLADAISDSDDEQAADPPAEEPPSQPDMGAQPTEPDTGRPMSDNQPTGTPNPTTPPAPTPPAPGGPAPTPPPAPAPAQPATGTPPARSNAVGPDGEDLGYPNHTALNEMTPEQREMYWRDKARKHEDRVKGMSDYDQLKEQAAEYQRLVEASRTEQERAVVAARQEGRADALREHGGRLVEQYVRASAATWPDQERVNALLEGLDRGKFITNGEVDAARVTTFVQNLAPAPAPATPAPQQPAAAPAAAPAPPRAPDMGQGTYSTAPPNGLEAGRAAARSMFPDEFKQQQPSLPI